MKIGFLFLMLLVLAGCHLAPLYVRTEYLFPSYLASKQVNTPDPCRLCYYGQQLVVHFRLPSSCSLEETQLLVSLRYGDHTVETLTVPLSSRSGYWTYRLVNDDYWMREGILSYQVELIQGEETVARTCHHLWAELIQITPS